MNFERLSSNLIIVIDEILSNQALVNYIGSDGDNPSKSYIDKKTIAPRGTDERIFPTPFDTKIVDKVKTQVHLYYPSIEFVNNSYACQVYLFIDIIVHKDIWLVTDDSYKVIRPYQIMNLLLKQLKDKNIKGVGKINFLEAQHLVVNQQFDGVRLTASFTEFTVNK